MNSNSIAFASSAVRIPNTNTNDLPAACTTYTYEPIVTWESTYNWHGHLPLSQYTNLKYSPKVFVGGISLDITDAVLHVIFKPYGLVHVERSARKNVEGPQCFLRSDSVYLLFDSDKSVINLLENCRHEDATNEYFFQSLNPLMRSKTVQIIPWMISDNDYLRDPFTPLNVFDANKTIFISALTELLSAEDLAKTINDLFDNVTYACINTDKYYYPIGSGHATFSTDESFMKAVRAAFVDIRTPKFSKKVKIHPFVLKSAPRNKCAKYIKDRISMEN